MNDVDVIIVGGGITGLACALKLHEANLKRPNPLKFQILESSPSLGGLIRTEKREGFLIEKGPDAFLSDKPEGIEFVRKLGLESELIGTNEKNRRSFVVSQGKLVALPEGFYLIAPMNAMAFLKSPLVSPFGKIRMLGEVFLPPRRDGNDESVASFIKRRFGKEALRRIGQPMVGGIYTGDPELLSARWSMPLLYALEKKYGSVIRGLKIAKKTSPRSESGPRYSLFVSLKKVSKRWCSVLGACCRKMRSRRLVVLEA